MKFNLKTPVINYDGVVVTEPDQTGQQVEVTFRAVINAALNRETGGVLTPEAKQQVFQISSKIWRSLKVDLTHDECVFIKERAGANLNPLLYGRLEEFLENREIELPLPAEEQDKEIEEYEKAKAKILTEKPSNKA